MSVQITQTGGAAAEKKCPDCHGRKSIELLTGAVACKRCQGTGSIPDLVNCGPSPLAAAFAPPLADRYFNDAQHAYLMGQLCQQLVACGVQLSGLRRIELLQIRPHTPAMPSGGGVSGFKSYLPGRVELLITVAIS